MATDQPHTLQRGDNDGRRIWGGAQRPGVGGEPVADLQRALLAIGALSAGADGDYGQKTHDAVRRFQWSLARMPQRLRVPSGQPDSAGTLEPFQAPAGLREITGSATPALVSELRAWQSSGCVLTSPLLRFSLVGLPRLGLGTGFRVLDYPSPAGDEALVHQDFAAAIQGLNRIAGQCDVTLRINQAFRVQDQPVSGAVVPPASNSQHLVGRALDCNIIDGNTINTADMINRGKHTEAAREVIRLAKAAGLRWGGDFRPTDPIHFDLHTPPAGDDYTVSFYLAQRSYARRHPLRSGSAGA